MSLSLTSLLADFASTHHNKALGSEVQVSNNAVGAVLSRTTYLGARSYPT